MRPRRSRTNRSSIWVSASFVCLANLLLSGPLVDRRAHLILRQLSLAQNSAENQRLSPRCDDQIPWFADSTAAPACGIYGSRGRSARSGPTRAQSELPRSWVLRVGQEG